MNSSALATIKEISDGILLKTGLPEHKAVQVDQLTRDGYRELNLYVLDEGRVIDLFTMDSNYIIPFPDDCIKINDIYVPRNGEVWSLTRRTSIPKITAIENGSEVIPEDWGGGEDISHGDGAYYQTSGGRNDMGYYEIDEAKRRILFRNIDRSEVMLDYNTSGINNTSTTYVPVEAKMALESFVLMQLASFGAIAVNTFSLHERNWEKQLSKLRMLDFNFTNFTDATYETFNSSVQR